MAALRMPIPAPDKRVFQEAFTCDKAVYQNGIGKLACSWDAFAVRKHLKLVAKFFPDRSRDWLFANGEPLETYLNMREPLTSEPGIRLVEKEMSVADVQFGKRDGVTGNQDVRLCECGWDRQNVLAASRKCPKVFWRVCDA